MDAPPQSEAISHHWSEEDGAKRIPYWIFQRQDIYEQERARIFQGPTWNFLGLEAEIPLPGDFVAVDVGHGSEITK